MLFLIERLIYVLGLESPVGLKDLSNVEKYLDFSPQKVPLSLSSNWGMRENSSFLVSHLFLPNNVGFSISETAY